MGNNKKKNRGSRSAGGTPAKLAAAAAAAPSVAEELEGLGAVPTLEGSPEELAAPLMEHYAGRQPAVVAGAAADWKAVATWNFGVLQSLVLSNCPRGEPVDLITYSSDGGYKVNRVADLMEYMELLRQRSITSKGAGKNCPALKRYGIDVPRKAIADSCPVPQVLQDLHASKALKMRDLMGRYFAKVATSGRSVFGLCRHPPLGYGHFIVQVKGSSTWLLYPPEEMPIRRDAPFYDALPGDFNSAKVRKRYPGGRVARLREGDMLFVPPYTCTSVRYEDVWNVTVDMLCMADEVWADTAQCPLAMADAAQLLGGRALLCYTMPSAMPDKNIIQKVQEGLLTATFDGDAALATRCMVVRGGDLESGLRAAALCTGGATMAECLLECTIANEAAFRSMRDCLKGLAILAYQQHSKGEGAMQELGVNVSALQAAAWSTLGRQPPAAGQRTAPGAAEAEVAGVVEEVAALWAAAPSKARKAKEAGEAEAAAARKQVEYVLGSMAAALDDMAFLLQQGEAAEGADKVAAVPEADGAPTAPRAQSYAEAAKAGLGSPLQSAESPMEETPPAMVEGRKAQPQMTSPPHSNASSAPSGTATPDDGATPTQYLTSPMTMALVAGVAAAAGLYYIKYSARS